MITKKSKKDLTEWWALVGEAKAPQIFSEMEDAAGRKFSFLATREEVYIYPAGAKQFYSVSMDQIGNGPGMGGFDLMRKIVGISEGAVAYRWLSGCLEGARGLART
jgi:hypothetical protein